MNRAGLHPLLLVLLGARVIVPGAEYRDRRMGHVNLLGLDHLIEPISTGGFATGAENFPPVHDVMLLVREAGAITGVAHGSTLGRQPTAVADAVLGTVQRHAAFLLRSCLAVHRSIY